MGFLVCGNAMMTCSFGVAPSVLMVLPVSKVMADAPVANIMDYKPFANILPFGMCQSVSNPMVAAATAAAFGVLTPMPCIPATAAPWTPGCPTVLVGGQPALTDSCKLMCSYGGNISISMAGQFKTQAP